ncbi:MAG: carboxypeptidase regulatory-like domain-containing protein [Deltaproteobacteria bacterium]|nr:carboxypeptidase regulatory-like domain-containing protein [Deltaproteobacteria bacterium]
MKKALKATALSIIGSLLLWAATPVWAAPYQVEAVSNGGTISGKVILSGKAPEPDKILITKNKGVCGDGYREIQWVPTDGKGGLQEMVVFLEDVAKGKEWDAKAFDKPTVDQKECFFTPWMQLVRKKDSLTVKNSDPVLHNIHIREIIGIKLGKPKGVLRTMVNEAQPGEKGALAKDLDVKVNPRRSNYIRINCEAHNFMYSWMFAAENPYVAKTGKDGSYSLENVPAGKYKLVSWHPTLGIQEQPIEVKAGGKAQQDFTYKAQ